MSARTAGTTDTGHRRAFVQHDEAPRAGEAVRGGGDGLGGGVGAEVARHHVPEPEGQGSAARPREQARRQVAEGRAHGIDGTAAEVFEDVASVRPRVGVEARAPEIGVGRAVEADPVPGGGDAARESGVGARGVGEEEEGDRCRVRWCGGEGVEEGGGGRGRGAVVEGEDEAAHAGQARDDGRSAIGKGGQARENARGEADGVRRGDVEVPVGGGGRGRAHSVESGGAHAASASSGANERPFHDGVPRTAATPIATT